MDEKLPEELIEKMRPLLREMADLIGSGVSPDRHVLEGILSKIDLAKDNEEPILVWIASQVATEEE